MKTTFIDLVPDPLSDGWKVVRVIKGEIGISMSPEKLEPLKEIGEISLPKWNPLDWMSLQVREQLTNEEESAIYEKIKDLEAVPEKEIHVQITREAKDRV